MIVDGKKIAEDIVAELGDSVRGRTLGLVVGASDAATESFIKIKSRMAARLGVQVVRGSTLEEVMQCDGIIIQMPIAGAEEMIAALPPEKDVDGLTAGALVRPPVGGAIAEILERNKVLVRHARAVVIGAGKLVGAPAAALLGELGADVHVVTNSRGSMDKLAGADIVVCGAGEPGLVTPNMLKRGVVLIDAGTSESAGKLAGDATPACAEVASLFTPVPGGVGPIAVAMIFKNLQMLAEVV